MSIAAAKGYRIESRSDYQATIVKGHRPNHILHLILSIITLGNSWLIVLDSRRPVRRRDAPNHTPFNLTGASSTSTVAGTWKYENGKVDATRRLLPQRWRTSPACSAFCRTLGYANRRSSPNSAALRCNQFSSSSTATNFNRPRRTQRNGGPMCSSKKSRLHPSAAAASSGVNARR